MFKYGNHYCMKKLWKMEVLQRDNNKCLSCETNLYIRPRVIFNNKSLAYDINNGITLCPDCYFYLKSGDYEQVCISLLIDSKFAYEKRKNEKGNTKI